MLKHRFLISISLGALMVLKGCHAEMSVEPPSVVRDAFNREHPGATDTHVEKETQSGGGTRYEYKYTDANGNKKTVEYDSQGNAVK
jgi:hypothetical protein